MRSTNESQMSRLLLVLFVYLYSCMYPNICIYCRYTPLAGAGEWLGRTVNPSGRGGTGTGPDSGTNDLTAMMMSRLHVEYLDMIPDITIPSSILSSESDKYSAVVDEIQQSLSDTGTKTSYYTASTKFKPKPNSTGNTNTSTNTSTAPSEQLKDCICDTLVMHVSHLSIVISMHIQYYLYTVLPLIYLIYLISYILYLVYIGLIGVVYRLSQDVQYPRSRRAAAGNTPTCPLWQP